MRLLTGLIGVCGLVWVAGCHLSPATPTPGERNTANNTGSSEQRPAAELFQPDLRGAPFYTDLSPETDGSAGGDYDVDVSPDGKQLVFSSTRYTTQPKVFLKDLESGAVYQKSSGPGRDIQPKFSPDGKWIAFSSNRDGNYNLLLLPSDRNEAYWQLTHSDADEIHPTWSPDGKRLAYSAREKDGEWNLWIIRY